MASVSCRSHALFFFPVYLFLSSTNVQISAVQLTKSFATSQTCYVSTSAPYDKDAEENLEHLIATAAKENDMQPVLDELKRLNFPAWALPAICGMPWSQRLVSKTKRQKTLRIPSILKRRETTRFTRAKNSLLALGREWMDDREIILDIVRKYWTKENKLTPSSLPENFSKGIISRAFTRAVLADNGYAVVWMMIIFIKIRNIKLFNPELMIEKAFLLASRRNAYDVIENILKHGAAEAHLDISVFKKAIDHCFEKPDVKTTILPLILYFP